MVESRISSCAGQLPDKPELLKYLHLQIENIGAEEKLKEIIERSKKEYTIDQEKKTRNYESVSLRRQGSEPHLPADLDECFDI